MFVPQHVLVRNLTDTFLTGGGDLRYEALDVSLRDVDGRQPTVGYRDPDGTPHVVACDFIAGTTRATPPAKESSADKPPARR
ncbi:hypothetical protein [Embleya sp. MST-111070]|uniref:hypothetical protein n=1 Tax=Embleya sp. MST-111070 TaxID=3398231 RepID=UPI003F734DB6